ncbi:MAG: hypothetical protein ACON3Z_17200 [Bradymonadia bacterium]
MGLWDSIKGAVNTLTGGQATVALEVGEATLGEDVFVRVKATAKTDISIDGVYLLVKASEFAEVRDVDYDFHDGRRRVEYVRGHHVTFNTRYDIAGPQQLSEGETAEWEATFQIPESENPTFDGQMISHTWELQAGLDVTGNDPDSGWFQFEVWDN